MRNPNYTPTLTRADYNRIRKYAPARNHLYCFLLSLLQEILSLANSEQENNVTWFAMAVFEMGRETGIREERHRRRAKSPIPSPPRKRGRTMTEPTTRAELSSTAPDVPHCKGTRNRPERPHKGAVFDWQCC